MFRMPQTIPGISPQGTQGLYTRNDLYLPTLRLAAMLDWGRSMLPCDNWSSVLFGYNFSWLLRYTKDKC